MNRKGFVAFSWLFRINKSPWGLSVRQTEPFPRMWADCKCLMLGLQETGGQSENTMGLGFLEQAQPWRRQHEKHHSELRPPSLTAHLCCPDRANAQGSDLVTGKVSNKAIYQPLEAPLGNARNSELQPCDSPKKIKVKENFQGHHDQSFMNFGWAAGQVLIRPLSWGNSTDHMYLELQFSICFGPRTLSLHENS